MPNLLTILNDLHIGAQRTAGTTPATQLALRQYGIAKFKSLLPQQGDLLILGDLFDTANVALSDVLAVYLTLTHWLNEHPTSKLYNVAGNHDLSKTSSVLSSFQFLGALLKASHPGSYVHVEEPGNTDHGYIIPHMRNQELFDLALSRVPETPFLFVHCNIDNNFAAQSDHSLNISAEQLESLKAAKIVCAHEHHMREFKNVVLPGNQIPTSVSDWLPEQDKFMAVIEDGVLRLETVATRATDFTTLDWKDIKVTEHKFVRVVGKAEPEEVSKAIQATSRLRNQSSAFVVTSAIETKTDSGDVAQVFSDNLESVQNFSVIEALKKLLTEEEVKIIEGLQC